ncbi:hypothetical protein GCM10007320_65600 [Pseudorhodoferax aquiterrae]|uniref:Uncharacterized protein n=1 Tax=Pseudorhodoferax aquiterrae TaxID=747304 RepID=A0ABQ3GH63_9BURK|nr:hypothetical protein [Pseudorhodoferax aquiterrae]GHD04627.1 hypothetical protein GCM10007320_65600 [Pseudorhodoferax aquiterrae]
MGAAYTVHANSISREPILQTGVQLSFDLDSSPPPVAAAPPPPSYTIKLRGSDLGARERALAEARFEKALEDKIGSSDQVRDLLRVLQEAEFHGRALIADEQVLARTWQRATLAARAIGLQNLADISDAWFEVRAS